MINDCGKEKMTCFSFYELGIWSTQLILQNEMKISKNKNYKGINFDDSIDFFKKRVNQKMLDMDISFLIDFNNISSNIIYQIPETFLGTQKEIKQNSYCLGRNIILWHSGNLATYGDINNKVCENCKKEIFIYLKSLNISDEHIFECLKIDNMYFDSIHQFNDYLNNKVGYFHKLVRVYLEKMVLYSNEDLSEDKHKYEYDVVLSFAGEDRYYVERVANSLKNKGVRVFYDKFETAKLFGKDLYQYLSYIYRDAAKYCMIFISRNYKEKVWAKHGKRSILG